MACPGCTEGCGVQTIEVISVCPGTAQPQRCRLRLEIKLRPHLGSYGSMVKGFTPPSILLVLKAESKPRNLEFLEKPIDLNLPDSSLHQNKLQGATGKEQAHHAGCAATFGARLRPKALSLGSAHECSARGQFYMNKQSRVGVWAHPISNFVPATQ